MDTDKKTRMLEIVQQLIPDDVMYKVKKLDRKLSSIPLAELRTKFPLSQREYQDIQNAVPMRELEYRISRSLVKRLLDISPLETQTSLYKKHNGAPNWPSGILGSVSHTKSICIAAITKSRQYSGLGIDVEVEDVEPDLEPFIVAQGESGLFPGHISHSATLRVIFCCKETIFKSLETYLTKRIDFLDVIVKFSKPNPSGIFEFRPEFTRNIPCLENFNPEHFCGKVYANEEMALSMAVIKPVIN